MWMISLIIICLFPDYEDYENEEMDGEDDMDRDRGTYEIIIDGVGGTGSSPGGSSIDDVRPPNGGMGPREPPREAARSAAVRPCDTSAELFTLQSTRLNAAQPLKGKLTNCHNSGCERYVNRDNYGKQHLIVTASKASSQIIPEVDQNVQERDL